MPLTPKLGDTEVRQRLAAIPRWSLVDCKLHREFEFGDFARAFGFMTSVAIHAEKRNHHPDWSNSYGRVTIDLSSHDVGGLSQRDFDLAAVIDALHG